MRSASLGRTLFGDLSKLNSTIDCDDFDINNLIPLFGAVIAEEPDEVIWDKVYSAVVESTPPPKSLSFLDQTPYLHTTSSFVNSSEKRKHVDAVLKEELGSIYVGVQGFHKAYFGGIRGLEEAGATLFRRFQEGHNPMFTDDGWRDWPESAKEREVLNWLASWISELRNIAVKEEFTMSSRRTVLAQPNRPLEGSTADRKLDIGIVRDSDSTSGKYQWSDVLILGELKM